MTLFHIWWVGCRARTAKLDAETVKLINATTWERPEGSSIWVPRRRKEDE